MSRIRAKQKYVTICSGDVSELAVMSKLSSMTASEGNSDLSIYRRKAHLNIPTARQAIKSQEKEDSTDRRVKDSRQI